MDEFNLATFYNGELLNLNQDDALSYCEKEGSRSNFAFKDSTDEVSSLSFLPALHNESRTDQSYGLGVSWDFPFPPYFRF